MRSRPRKTKTELTPAGARDKALRALARREHSAAELQRKLEYRGYGEEDAETAVEELTRAGWQSDARYAEALLRSRIAQGHGPQRIEAELEHAGVSSADISAAFASAETDWSALAAQLRLRKFGARLPKQAADWQKQYRYLAGRGFSPEQIHAALKNAPDDTD